MRATVNIAIVGAGPRGIITLERICANATALTPDRQVTIHLIDPFEAGSGRIWRRDQPRSLLMNSAACEVTVFVDESVQCDGPITSGPTQYQWAKMVANSEIETGCSITQGEAQQMKPWSYPSRVMHGEYLRWALNYIELKAPDNVSIVRYQYQAVKLTEESDSRYAVRLEDGSRLNVDAVVLSVGHYDMKGSQRVEKLSEEAGKFGLVYIQPGNASEADLRDIKRNENVFLNGMGLSFFDYVTLLTSGRGGEFRSVEGGLAYTRSGAEPKLFAISRKGLPYRSRAESYAETPVPYRPKILTGELIQEFRIRSGCYVVDFNRDIWPIILKELLWAYYTTLLRGSIGNLDILWDSLSRNEWGSDETARIIDKIVPDKERQFDWNRVENPAFGRRFKSISEYSEWIKVYLETDCDASVAGPERSPIKAVSAAMRDLRGPIRQVVSYRGISGNSYMNHIENWYNGLNNMIASGPPRSRISELIALRDAGVIEFVGPKSSPTVDEKTKLFTAQSALVANSRTKSRVLIDAFLPKNDIRVVSDRLLCSMLNAGSCRPFSIPNHDGTYYQTGGIEVDEFSFRVVKSDGSKHDHVYCYGPPIESVQWVTAMTARPGVNSQILLQADIIARDVLESI